jgi:hypothetical protein
VLRWSWLVVLVASVAVLAPAPAAGAGVPDPCKLVRAADVRAIVGPPLAAPRSLNLGLYRSCFYTTTNARAVTVQTRRISRSDFVKSAKANPGRAEAVPGIGAVAYSVGNGAQLLVWRNGTEATFLVVGVANPLASEKRLARRVVGRL